MNPIRTYLIETWSLIAGMGPYFLLGFLVTGLLHKWIRQQWIEQHLSQPRFKSIVLASIFGLPMPLSSCGVITVTASLREKGASKGAATSFLTATPQMGIDSILATYGMLGPVLALHRVVIAFISEIGVILIVKLFSKKNEVAAPRSSGTESAKPTWTESLNNGPMTLPEDIAVSLFVGFLLTGLVGASAPDDLLANPPREIYISILLTNLIATPLYICLTVSIPLALALIDSALTLSADLNSGKACIGCSNINSGNVSTKLDSL
jgi:hypothetical protein